MKRYSLRLRLLVGAGIAIFAALALAWIVMTLLFARHLERRAELELRREALQLVAGLGRRGDRINVLQSPADPRFATPGSGLYWQVVTAGGAIRSRSLWDQALAARPIGPTDDWQIHSDHGPFERRIYVLQRWVRPDAGFPAVLVQVAEEEGSLHAARAEFGRELAAFLALLWLALALAAWMQVRLGLRPLARLRAEVIGLRHRPNERLAGNHPSEILPLIDAINGLIEAREGDVRRARQRAADLAHGLKTPLAALAAQSRLIRQGAPDAANGLERALSSAQASVEAELARARASMARQTLGVADPARICARLIAVLERTDKGMRIDIDNRVPGTIRIAMAEDDLTELLGPLLDNAVRFARRIVAITGEDTAADIVLRIEDDGPGLDPTAAERVLARGVRLDERGSGHGLGLSIARDLVEATGGTILLESAALGGLAVVLRWPHDIAVAMTAG